ncbi:MAG: hypothetical protein WA951_04900 [Leeuwenhoekiella sp.]
MNHSILTLTLSFFFLLACQTDLSAQNQRSDFWDRVSYGGNLGLNFGNGYFSGSISPSAIYEFNPYFSAGPGLSFSYVKDDFYKATLVGGSVIALVNPYRYIQFSAEIEELYVSQEILGFGNNRSRDFWNTALFLGLGYRNGPLTIGVRYNVLFDEEDRVYTEPFQPFVRIYF